MPIITVDDSEESVLTYSGPWTASGTSFELNGHVFLSPWIFCPITNFFIEPRMVLLPTDHLLPFTSTVWLQFALAGSSTNTQLVVI